MGTILPTIITIFDDRSFTFEMREPPMTYLIKKALGLTSGSATPHKVKVGKLTNAQLEAIAKEKMPDLNANDLEAAKMIVRGSARSMGIESE
jgi:large subunit ribosomal protein L11